MSATDSYNTAAGREEHILKLPDGRVLAYAHNGPPKSRTVVIFFGGLFSIGTAPNVPEPLQKLGAHWISPTNPGMGTSDARRPGEAYHRALVRDIVALLDHLYSTGDFDKLYISGGSYGTVQAQMLYGAPYDQFPAGRKIAGCLLLAGFSPFKHHAGYTKTLTWQNWISVGPPSQLIPFNTLQRVMSSIIAAKMKTSDSAKTLMQDLLFSKMDKEERETFAKWARKRDTTEEQFIAEMADNGRKSVAKTWQGFLEASDVLHSDWGFAPAELDEEHASKPVMVVGSEKDDMGGSTNAWMAENYKNATLKIVPGGHISAVFFMDELWQEFLDANR
jgi:pimeloyl-ACP methyl ester carboxylesterase